MKLIVTFFLTTTLSMLLGTVHIVNNLPNTDPDFTNLSSAYSAAQPGDTLYVCGSVTNYGSLTLAKPLTIIGPGYFLASNPYTQVNTRTAALTLITFNAGSSGSLITGLQAQRAVVNTSNITIVRNYFYYTDSSSYMISFASGLSNIAIMQNYFYLNYDLTSLYGIITSGSNNILYIANNLFRSDESRNITISSTSYATMENNVFYGGTVSIYNTLFQNNIMRSGTFDSNSGNTILNNISAGSQFGDLNGNQSNVSMSAVFTLSGSTDGNYILAPGSPAIGAGVNGVDCGIFGGISPYVLSGMPEGIPSIYEFSAPSSGFTFPVHLKAHAH